MKISALIKFSVDSIMRKFVKSAAITLLFAFALVLIAMCMIPNRIGAYSYHTLDRMLQKGVKGTGSVHMNEYKEECWEFAEKLRDIPGIWKAGFVQEQEIGKKAIMELYQIQDGHVPNRTTIDSGMIQMDKGYTTIDVTGDAWEMFRFRLAEGSYVPNDNPGDTSVVHLYLGNAYADIPVGKEYKTEWGTTIKVMGIFEKGAVCVTNSYINNEFTSAAAVTLDYLAVAVSNANTQQLTSDILFSVENVSEMQPVINRIYDLAKQYEIDVRAGSLDGMLQENQKTYGKISEMLLELLLIVLLVAATIQACVQIVDMLGHFPMYGILYANGASKRDLCVLIVLENSMRYAAACAISYGIIRLLLVSLFLEAELLETVTRIFHMETAAWVYLIGLGVCMISIAAPLIMIQRRTPVELVSRQG